MGVSGGATQPGRGRLPGPHHSLLVPFPLRQAARTAGAQHGLSMHEPWARLPGDDGYLTHTGARGLAAQRKVSGLCQPQGSARGTWYRKRCSPSALPAPSNASTVAHWMGMDPWP